MVLYLCQTEGKREKGQTMKKELENKVRELRKEWEKAIAILSICPSESAIRKEKEVRERLNEAERECFK